MTELVERYCVVCGMGSHRTDWVGRTPACDNHTKEEIAAALKAKAPTPAPPAPKANGGKTPSPASTQQEAPAADQPSK